MQRLILSFTNLTATLQALKALKDAFKSDVRPTSTPAKFSHSLCSLSIEVLDKDKKQVVLDRLASINLKPAEIIEF